VSWLDDAREALPPEVRVPSPYGVYKDGTFTPFPGRETEPTRFPALLDPESGWPVETRLWERVALTYGDTMPLELSDWTEANRPELEIIMAMIIDAMQSEFSIQEKPDEPVG